MQSQGEPPGTPNPVGGMPATDDEIREKYLERAIRELNHFTRELQTCDRCPRGHLMPVLGSGHPQADVMLLKYAPTPAEIEEGVAFYGRAGSAVMKSLRRLDIDPLLVYGTLCVKCPVADTSLAAPEAKPGSAIRSTARAATALSSSERARSVGPWMRPRLAISACRFSSTFGPAPTPTTAIRPLSASASRLAGQL